LILGFLFVFDQADGRIDKLLHVRQHPPVLLGNDWANDPVQFVAIRTQSCNQTPGQTRYRSQINPFSQGHRQAALFTCVEVFGWYIPFEPFRFSEDCLKGIADLDG
jgi:hypothetical protein